MSTVLLMTPLLRFLAVYILAAILPAAFLLRYIYRHDTVEKEPPGLLFKLLVMGVLAALCSGVLERLGETVLTRWWTRAAPSIRSFWHSWWWLWWRRG